MATTTEVNATLIKYDASGNQTVIYPKTKATNVTITSNSNYSTTNLQTLITALGSLAFRSYTIVTSVDNAASGTLVDGSVISSMNETLTSLQTEVSEMSSVQNGLEPFTGATSSTAGTSGLAPAPSKGYNSEYYLCGNGEWVYYHVIKEYTSSRYINCDEFSCTVYAESDRGSLIVQSSVSKSYSTAISAYFSMADSGTIDEIWMKFYSSPKWVSTSEAQSWFSIDLFNNHIYNLSENGSATGYSNGYISWTVSVTAGQEVSSSSSLSEGNTAEISFKPQVWLTYTYSA